MTERELIREKHRADAFRTTASDPHEGAYWHAYRIGLVGRSEHHDAILAGIGSVDVSHDARGRGYRDGLAFRA